jgi:hypothetical protein
VNAAGTYTAIWDDRTDWGAKAPRDVYTIKVLAHNVNYVWEGVVGNTSAEDSGQTVHHNIHFATALCFTGTNEADTNGFYACGYTENSPPFFGFAGSSPQKVSRIINGCTTGGNDYAWHFADSDGAHVAYFACPVTARRGDNELTNPGAVCAFNTDGSVMPFSRGGEIYEQYHSFVNGVHVGRHPSITGLAVEKIAGDRLMAVSVATDNAVYLLDKTTGAAVGAFTVKAPGALAFDTGNNLWVATGKSVRRYAQINTSPRSPKLETVIDGFAEPLALAVSPGTAAQPNLLLVADGGRSQQIKAYDLSGRPQWTYGKVGGYASDPTVTTDKFWFHEGQESLDLTSLAFQPDGSFWIIDPMNNRMLHFALGAGRGEPPTYQNQIEFMETLYCVSVDMNNPTRVFGCADGKWLEFKINYALPLAGTNGSWTLVKNWGYGLSPRFYTPFISGLSSVATLRNGLTYALLADDATKKSAVYELPARGPLRATGVPETSAPFLYADGSLRYQTCRDGTDIFTLQRLTGFDHARNPQWSGPVTVATAPGVQDHDPTDGTNSGGPRVELTPSNTVVFFDNSANLGMHLGGINLDRSRRSWAWETSPAIRSASSPTTDLESTLWGDGSYDAAADINYEGGLDDSIGRDIVYLYKGENWQRGEASQLMHYNDDGLFVGQFGTAGNTSLICALGFGGNYQMDAMTKAGASTYLYTNDESQHGGIHRWRLDGLDTEAEVVGRGPLDSTITLEGAAPAMSPPVVQGAPEAVTHFQAAPGNGNVFLSWQTNPAGPSPVYYQVRRSASPSGLYQIIATSIPQANFTDDRIRNGSTYYYEVIPVNQFGAGAASPPVPARPSAASGVYEAERGVLEGTQVRADQFASGNYEVADSKAGSVTIPKVNGGNGGTFLLDIRYSWPYGTWTRASLKVNGQNMNLPPFPKTPEGPPVFGDVTVKIQLNSGDENTLVMTDNPILDKFTVTPIQ